jgi:DNA-binding response OmpR family regulator
MHDMIGATGIEGLQPNFSPPQDDGRPRLLLVDDDTMVGRFIGHAAEECGVHAVRTSSLETFRQRFHQSRPDIVAVDLSISGHDGIEIIRLLAEEAFGGRVIIISGLARRVLDAAMRLGTALGLRMAEPLSKPFRIEDLAKRLAGGDSTPVRSS